MNKNELAVVLYLSIMLCILGIIIDGVLSLFLFILAFIGCRSVVGYINTEEGDKNHGN